MTPSPPSIRWMVVVVVALCGGWMTQDYSNHLFFRVLGEEVRRSDIAWVTQDGWPDWNSGKYITILQYILNFCRFQMHAMVMVLSTDDEFLFLFSIFNYSPCAASYGRVESPNSHSVSPGYTWCYHAPAGGRVAASGWKGIR